MTADPTTDTHAFPLALAGRGERLRIAAMKAGKGLNRRLGDLGLPVGSEVVVVLRQANGSVVVARNNQRVALGAGMAQMIMVTLSGEAAPLPVRMVAAQ